MGDAATTAAEEAARERRRRILAKRGLVKGGPDPNVRSASPDPTMGGQGQDKDEGSTPMVSGSGAPTLNPVVLAPRPVATVEASSPAPRMEPPGDQALPPGDEAFPPGDQPPPGPSAVPAAIPIVIPKAPLGGAGVPIPINLAPVASGDGDVARRGPKDGPEGGQNRENEAPQDPNMVQTGDLSDTAMLSETASPLLQPKRPEGHAKESLRERLRMRETRRKQQQTEREASNQKGQEEESNLMLTQGGVEQQNPMLNTGAMSETASPNRQTSALARFRARRLAKREEGEGTLRGTKKEKAEESSDSEDEQPRQRRLEKGDKGRRLMTFRAYHRHMGVPGHMDLSRFMPRALIGFFQRPLPLLKVGLGVFYASQEGAKFKEAREKVPESHTAVIRIMQADFQTTSDVIQPLVRMHVLDGSTGHYLRVGGAEASKDGKGNKARTAGGRRGSHEEAEEDKGKGGESGQPLPGAVPVAPLMTRPFPLRGSSLCAQWQQTLSVDIPYRALLRPEVLILFEVLDRATTLSLRKRRRNIQNTQVAWAFLRPLSLKGQAMVPLTPPSASSPAPPFRLQLYEYQYLGPLATVQAHFRDMGRASWGLSQEGNANRVPPVYLQYLLRQKAKQPSTLHVQLYPHAASRLSLFKMSQLNDPSAPSLGPQGAGPQGGEGGEAGGAQGGVGATQKIMEQIASSTSAVKRARGIFENCLLPNTLLFRLQAGRQGSMCLRFSNGGSVLAVGCCGDKAFPLRLYDTESGSLLADLRPPHASLVYDMQWSDDDRHLVSASADGTALVWRVHDRPREMEPGEENAAGTQGPPSPTKAAQDIEGTENLGLPRLVATLQHRPPLYLYCVCFPYTSMEEGSLTVISGAYDGGLRMWDVGREKEVGLVGGMVYHESHVNALAVDRRNGRMYSGDGIGVILVWKRTGGEGHRAYGVLHRIVNPDLDRKPIMSLCVHPTRRKGQLLAMAQSNVLRLIDLYTYRFVNSGYAHASCNGSRVRAVFSPDGRYVMAGSEDGKLRTWEAQSGKMVLQGGPRNIGFTEPLIDVAWHPRQHVVALASFGEDMPVLLYHAEKGEEETVAEGEEGQGEREERGKKGDEEDEAAAREAQRMARLAELKAKWLVPTGGESKGGEGKEEEEGKGDGEGKEERKLGGK